MERSCGGIYATYVLAFLFAIIIAAFRWTARIPADERARGTVVEECRISVGRKNAYRFARARRFGARANASVPEARCGGPVVTDERFYRTSRCNREACVILLSIPFSLVELHIKNFNVKFIFQEIFIFLEIRG